MTAIALGWLVVGRRFETRHRFALFGQFQAQFAAGIGLAVKHLGDRGRSTHFAEREHFDLKSAAVVFDLQHVAGADIARGLDRLSIALNSAQFTSA